MKRDWWKVLEPEERNILYYALARVKPENLSDGLKLIHGQLLNDLRAAVFGSGEAKVEAAQ